MAYRDLRDFIAQLESAGDLKRVTQPVDPKLEMTALCDRALRAQGPALLFEHPLGDRRGPGGSIIPVLGNLGCEKRNDQCRDSYHRNINESANWYKLLSCRNCRNIA